MQPLATLAMRTAHTTLVRQIIDVARFELRGLRAQPGLYLFAPLILIDSYFQTTVAVGPFDTPLLMTPGVFAVQMMNPMTFYVCLLLMFYTVESLERERNTGLAPIYYATPVRTGAVLFGKALANSIVGVVILLAGLVAGVLLLLVQGEVGLDIGPFFLVWGLLLVPTFILWTSFVTAVLAVVGNRYTSYAVSLGVLILTHYLLFRNKMNWVGNWELWSAVQWSDMGVFELCRPALILNRIAALGAAVFFTALTVRIFPRREFDSARVVDRLRPISLLRGSLRLVPFAIVPFVVLVVLAVQVSHGWEGRATKNREKEYWQKNLATFREAPLPAITAVDLDLSLDPARRWFHAEGAYDLTNQKAEALDRIPVTSGDHWENVSWTLNGAACTPENRAKLCVFTPEKPLKPGETLRIGFKYDGTFPKGISRNGGGTMEFILPSGVVLTSFGPSFVPVLGWMESVGVEEENRYETRVYPDDFYEGITDSMLGSLFPYKTKVRVTAPQEYTLNSVGTLVTEEVKEGRRTVVWESDYPVNFFNVVAGRWKVREGEGTKIFYHPEHTYNIEEMGTALDAARRFYSEWFFPFPWRELKLSEFPALSGYAQGFPTDITFSEGIGFLTQSSAKANAAFLVTAHESAHQWWGNLICPGKGPGGNILSEGTSHFSSILLFEQVKGLQGRIETCKGLEDRYAKSRRVNSERAMVKVDGSRDGDTTVTYDKGGWVFWMLHRLMGREANLKGIQAFFQKYVGNEDHPVLQDFVREMRPFAPDADAYDAFVKQWFFDVVVPEYRLSDAKREKAADRDEWTVTVTVENKGAGRMPVEIAATRADRFKEQTEGEAAKGPAPVSPDYRDERTSIVLGAGEKTQVTIRCAFEPDKIVVDPDALVLQLQRKSALWRF